MHTRCQWWYVYTSHMNNHTRVCAHLIWDHCVSRKQSCGETIRCNECSVSPGLSRGAAFMSDYGSFSRIDVIAWPQDRRIALWVSHRLYWYSHIWCTRSYIHHTSFMWTPHTIRDLLHTIPHSRPYRSRGKRIKIPLLVWQSYNVLHISVCLKYNHLFQRTVQSNDNIKLLSCCLITLKPKDRLP